MRPTSSSTARRSTISNAYAAPPSHPSFLELERADRAMYYRMFHGPHTVTQGSRIPRSTSNAADRPAAQVNLPPRKASLAAATGNPSCTAARSKVEPASTAPQVVAGAATALTDNGGGEIDLTVIKGAQDRRFWAGRYTAMSDRIRNDPVISPTDASYANSDEQHQRFVLDHLRAQCADEQATESLNAFVRAWAQGWTRGTAGAFLGVAPEPVVPARLSVTEEKKKNGFIGKVFGRRKS
ncbi:MAG: hypothetical protein Q9226_000954 [Calogaya cf. arnoldii]